MDSTTSTERERRFRRLFDSVYVDLLRFVCRRVGAERAEDVVGDVMLVAWRRLDDMPVDLSDARAWVFGVARRTLQAEGRREGRQQAVAVRLAQLPVDASGGRVSDLVAHRIDVSKAWLLLSPGHQEALALAVLDGLSAPEASSVLGISPTAFRLRLSRARRALRGHLDSHHRTGDPVPVELAQDRSSR